MKPTSVIIQSVKDGATLELSAADYPASDSFEFKLNTPVFSVSGSGSTYVVGSPALFFDRMASSWRGWEGVLKWAPLENEIILAATMDHLGHVEMLVELRSTVYPSDWELKFRLHLEAGGLESLARRVKQAFPIHENVERK
jgi:hypothetical protein